MKNKKNNVSKKKTKKEQVIEIYKQGETNTQEIARQLGVTIGTINNYLSIARKQGIIERKKTKKEQVIEIYKQGETNSQVIAKKAGTTVQTVYNYLTLAREEGKIPKRNKSKTKKEQIIEIYNLGETNLQVIADKVKSTTQIEKMAESKSKNKTKREQVIEIYKQGETNPQVIAKKLGVTIGTINNYLSKARREGIIERKKTKKDQVIELYNQGETNPQAIAKKLGTTVQTVYDYLNLAQKEEKIPKRNKSKTKKEQIIEIYNLGEKNPQTIATKLGNNIQTVYYTLYQIKRQGDNENHREKKKDLNQKEIKPVVMPKTRLQDKEKNTIPKIENTTDEKLKNKVKVLLETKYPREIAEQLKISPKIVYDVIDSLGKDYIKKLKVRKVKRSPLYSQIVNLRKAKNLNMEKALYTILKTNLRLKDRIELAKIYYLLGNEKVPERLLNEIISDEIATSSMKKMAREEKDKILLEIKTGKIREDYKNGRNMDGTKISFDDLCRKYNVRTRFLIEVIGQEEIDYSR